MQVEGQHRLLRVFAHQLEETLLVLNVDQLFVDTGLDMNDHGIGGAAGGDRHDCFLHRFELAAPISGNDQVYWPYQSYARTEGGEHMLAEHNVCCHDCQKYKSFHV